MNSKTIIITGANSGIGKAAAQQLTKEGHRVVLACRDLERAEIAQKEIGGESRIALLNLADLKSIHTFTDWAHHNLSEVDVLINNAATFDLSKTEREINRNGFETIWFTNHLAQVLLTDRLMDMLVASSQGRIINISSKGLLAYPFLTVNLKDPMFKERPFSVSKAYYQSKLAQIMYTNWLARQITGTMVTANCIRVTNVKINTDRFPNLPLWQKRLYALKAQFAISPEKMAETYVQAATAPLLKNRSGALIDHPFNVVNPPAYAKDALCMEQLMQLTYQQLGTTPSITYQPAN